MTELTPSPESLLTRPDCFPGDCSDLVDDFSDFYKNKIKADFKGLEYLREVYVSMASIRRILNEHEDCAGFALYCAKVPVKNPDTYPTDPGKMVDRITIAIVGVSAQGNLLNKAGDGACYITKPCPPYCPTWGLGS